MAAILGNIMQVSVNVKDMARARAFYRDRLGLTHLFDAGPALSFFDCEGVRLMLGVAEKPEFDHPGSILYFNVKDIAGAHGELASRGVAFAEPPHRVARMPGHDLWLAFFRDSEGNPMALMCEMPVAA
jgi:methylmalonyl-CoA/ethylmalonyl-CoA epimerase